jgi:hypothetical protein
MYFLQLHERHLRQQDGRYLPRNLLPD